MKLHKWVLKKEQRYEGDPEFILDWILLNISEKILERLEYLGWSQKKFAMALGVSQPYVTRLINGKPNLTIESLVKIVTTIGLKLNIQLDERPKPIQALDIPCVDEGDFQSFEVTYSSGKKGRRDDQVNYSPAA